MAISFNSAITQNFEEATKREWLETNGLGGWASSTLAGLHTRRYHGLLVAATKPPVGRVVLLSKLDESILVGDQRFDLGANRYPNAVSPNGYVHLRSFSKKMFPLFEYEAEGVVLRKTIAAIHDENTTVVLYELLEAPSSITLDLLPLLSPRDYHSLSHANDAIRSEGTFTDGMFRVQSYDNMPELFVSIPHSEFTPKPEWYYNFEYLLEQYRGLDYREDLFSHGTFTVQLKPGGKLGVIISTDNPTGRDAFSLADKEMHRRERLLDALPFRDEMSETLALAADQFIVKRGEDQNTLIAGYHWFTDWGRDTMIALPGICLVTGRYHDAKNILRAFAQSVSQGMLPNRFPDGGEEPEYNTVDATLWFFVAIYKYLHYTHDDAFIRDELMPILRDIISWHDRGTRYNIHVDTDGLLYAGEPGVQLTWMDAKVGNWVVTPRQGKAVEINALWFNALKIYSELASRYELSQEATLFARRAEALKQKFDEVFWNEDTGALYDYVDGEYKDAAIRPNQLFALSLPFPLLEKSKAEKVLRVVEEKLYTSVGLRSLSPDDPAYRGSYGGDQLSRESAYHQGTVWSWLLGPLCSAIVNVEGDSGRKRTRDILEIMVPHFMDAGVGTVSEIFDGNTPHTSRGCIAQAWSVGELLRAHVEDVEQRP